MVSVPLSGPSLAQRSNLASGARPHFPGLQHPVVQDSPRQPRQQPRCWIYAVSLASHPFNVPNFLLTSTICRFETREICDEIIAQYNGISIGDECQLMNIRYADTPAQKELKRVTAERRQFRTNEYNIGAYGTTLVGMHPQQLFSGPVIRRPANNG